MRCWRRWLLTLRWYTLNRRLHDALPSRVKGFSDGSLPRSQHPIVRITPLNCVALKFDTISLAPLAFIAYLNTFFPQHKLRLNLTTYTLEIQWTKSVAWATTGLMRGSRQSAWQTCEENKTKKKSLSPKLSSCLRMCLLRRGLRAPLICLPAILISAGGPLHLSHLCGCFVMSATWYWIRASKEEGVRGKNKTQKWNQRGKKPRRLEISPGALFPFTTKSLITRGRRLRRSLVSQRGPQFGL